MMTVEYKGYTWPRFEYDNEVAVALLRVGLHQHRTVLP